PANASCNAADSKLHALAESILIAAWLAVQGLGSAGATLAVFFLSRASVPGVGYASLNEHSTIWFQIGPVDYEYCDVVGVRGETKREPALHDTGRATRTGRSNRERFCTG